MSVQCRFWASSVRSRCYSRGLCVPLVLARTANCTLLAVVQFFCQWRTWHSWRKALHCTWAVKDRTSFRLVRRSATNIAVSPAEDGKVGLGTSAVTTAFSVSESDCGAQNFTVITRAYGNNIVRVRSLLFKCYWSRKTANIYWKLTIFLFPSTW